MYDPRHLTFEAWSTYTGADLARFGVISTRASEAEWRGWAASLRMLPAVAALNIPDPQGYPDWQSWAYRFNEAAASLGV